MAAQPPAEPHRFLIVRLSAVGDTVLTLPIASALRRRFPDAHIAWVVERRSSLVVSGHHALDDVVILERRWFTRPRRALRVRQALRRGHFDVTIDTQGLAKSALAARLSGAPRRIGFGGEYGRELSPWLHTERVVPTRRHVVDRSLELLAPLGIHDPEVEWGFPIDGASRRRARDTTEQRGLEAGYAIVNPSATWASKLWEVDRFAVVIRHLARRHQLPTLIVWGDAREREQAAAVAAAAGESAILAPRTNLTELAALLESGRLFVSADSGPLHIGVAVGIPTIGLYGPTWVEECGPYGSRHVGVQVEFQSGSHRERRRADNRAMRKITVDRVLAECDARLG